VFNVHAKSNPRILEAGYASVADLTTNKIQSAEEIRNPESKKFPENP